MPQFNVPLKGKVEPPAPSWATATAADRRAFYRRCGEVGVRVLRAQLARGVGVTGRRMAPRKHPRADHADGPVLTPHRAESRTARLLDFRATESGVTLFWHGGGGQGHRPAWSKVLGWHAAGAVKGGPARDVRMSPASVRAVRDEMAAWWETRVRRQRPDGKPKPPTPAAPTLRPGTRMPALTPLAARGLTFRPTPGRRVTASVAALDEAWKTDPGYIPAGGDGSPAYRRAVAMVRQAASSGEPLHVVRVALKQPGAAGAVTVTDGRHLLAAMRDMRVKTIPVGVDRADAARARERFGAGNVPKLAGKAKGRVRAEQPPPARPVKGPPLRVEPQPKPLTKAVASYFEPKAAPVATPKGPGLLGRVKAKVTGWLKGLFFGGG